ncbi:MFS transporter [Planctopirus limnophila]|nr:MFS transporter [Planctopirus limnophila]
MKATLPMPAGLSIRIALTSFLWQAGSTLTSGVFFNWFVQEAGAKGWMLGLLLALPDLCGLAGLYARPLLQSGWGRRHLWWFSTVVSRLFFVCIPGIALLHHDFPDPQTALWLIILAISLASIFQGIAFAAWSDWISLLAAPPLWGRTLAIRSMAMIATQLLLPFIAAAIRDFAQSQARMTGSNQLLIMVYAGIFLTGVLLQLASLLPMLALPEVSLAQVRRSTGLWATLRESFQQPGYGWLIAHAWCLGAANGLTQAVLAQYQYQILKMSILPMQAMFSLMYLIQLPASWQGGQFSSRQREGFVLTFGTAITASSMLFFYFSSPQFWWMIGGAYVAWGAFGAVNVAGPHMALRLSPEGDRSASFAVFRLGAGMAAGLSGIAGAWWLSWLLEASTPENAMAAYQTLFLASLAGRCLASLLACGTWCSQKHREG